MIDVLRILGTRPEKFESKLEELAARMVAGEKVSREEIKAFLAKTETAPEDLQREIDRLQRREELKASIRDAMPARKAAGNIEAELQAAQNDVDKAVDILDRLKAKYGQRLFDLRSVVEVADRAVEALIEYRNLPPSVAARLKQARDGANAASGEVDRITHELPQLRAELRQGEEALTRELETLALNRDDAGVQEQVQRARTAVKTRGDRLTAGEKALVEAQKALVEARRRRDTVTAEIKTQYAQEQ